MWLGGGKQEQPEEGQPGDTSGAGHEVVSRERLEPVPH